MITDVYCSYEISKLLEDKGFDIITDNVYDNNKILDYQNIICVNENRIPYVNAPTHQLAMKWLREVHNKHCDIGYDVDLDWFFQIIDLKETIEYDYTETKYYHAENETGFKTYEDAVEASIKFVLENLI